MRQSGSMWKFLVACSLLLGSISLAADRLDPAGKYPLRTDWREPAPPFLPLTDARYENEFRYDSFAGSGGGAPLITNISEQAVRWKTLPPEKGVEQFEMTFEKYRSLSKVALTAGGGAMENVQDYSVALAGQPLRLSGREPDRVENLAKVKESAMKSSRDAIAKQGLTAALQENTLLDGARSFLQRNSCLAGMAHKNIGDRWQMSFVARGQRMEVACEFRGWAEAGGERVLVIQVSLPKTSKGTITTEGAGELLFVPSSRESLLRLKIDLAESQNGKPPAISQLTTRTHARSAAP